MKTSQLGRDLRLNSVPSRDAPPQPRATTIKVEKGVPMPAAMRAPKPSPYPFAEMAIGDSFAVSVPIGEQPKALSQLIRSRLSAYCRHHPEFAAAVRIEVGERSVRCWRVEKSTEAKRGRPRKAA